ncbi:rhodoquinone biosynthesis methyltransferase RquA [Marimonas arenosa]|uniref:Rhodoquinone biosynthesis methyltransferase RquA n=1 Tax=Marimonas arenosa TaxID=1795305 RepID=A0AAE3WE88_9RHOB|nr:rhodoquinone biosynthesis methyltransferase RquA [Marimonas arenosa]MDQ2091651.1 rhodoquinone biosynthesis methyltransferase RquA [Marimonas arenosa]
MNDIGDPFVSTDSLSSKGTAFESATSLPSSELLNIPEYLNEVYHWAYLNPRNVAILDRELVVSAILWGQHRRLQRVAFEEIAPGSSVFLPAHVYGSFVPNLAHHIGPKGRLDISDISPAQIAICKRKVKDIPWVSICRADARHPTGGRYEMVCCYFLLHELPDSYKHSVVDALLENLRPGGKVVFVDYHKPKWSNPVKPFVGLVFDMLEPFAKSIWQHEIEEFATKGDEFSWRKETYFGDLYQRVVATKR